MVVSLHADAGNHTLGLWRTTSVLNHWSIFPTTPSHFDLMILQWRFLYSCDRVSLGTQISLQCIITLNAQKTLREHRFFWLQNLHYKLFMTGLEVWWLNIFAVPGLLYGVDQLPGERRHLECHSYLCTSVGILIKLNCLFSKEQIPSLIGLLTYFYHRPWKCCLNGYAWRSGPSSLSSLKQTRSQGYIVTEMDIELGCGTHLESYPVFKGEASSRWLAPLPLENWAQAFSVETEC